MWGRGVQGPRPETRKTMLTTVSVDPTKLFWLSPPLALSSLLPFTLFLVFSASLSLSLFAIFSSFCYCFFLASFAHSSLSLTHSFFFFSSLKNPTRERKKIYHIPPPFSASSMLLHNFEHKRLELDENQEKFISFP